jgi:hypothetical protein
MTDRTIEATAAPGATGGGERRAGAGAAPGDGRRRLG